MITAYRIYKKKHAATAFTGVGAREYGGRFNSKGTAIVYAASSVSLAAFEILVHIESHDLMTKYLVRKIEFDEALVSKVTVDDLPPDWRADPAPPSTQAFGDNWVASGASAVLEVPSAVVPWDHNYLLNPEHADFPKITIHAEEVFAFDPRLLKT